MECHPDFMLLGHSGTAFRRKPVEFRITRAVRAGVRAAIAGHKRYALTDAAGIFY